MLVDLSVVNLFKGSWNEMLIQNLTDAFLYIEVVLLLDTHRFRTFEKPEGPVKNEQSKDVGNIEHKTQNEDKESKKHRKLKGSTTCTQS